MEHRSLTLGEVLDGDRMAVAMHEINFKRKLTYLMSLITYSYAFHLQVQFTSVLRKPISDREVFLPRANCLNRRCYVEFCEAHFYRAQTLTL